MLPGTIPLSTCQCSFSRLDVSTYIPAVFCAVYPVYESASCPAEPVVRASLAARFHAEAGLCVLLMLQAYLYPLCV